MIALVMPSYFSKVLDAPMYHNSGKLQGWDDIFHEHKGTVEEITVGSSSKLKFTQTYDPEYYGRYHSEVERYDAALLGEQGYYGFAFQLDPAWKTDRHMYTISQFISNFKDITCNGHHTRNWSPTTMTYIIGHELFTRVRFGDMCIGEQIHEFKIGTVKPGAWHTVVLGVKWDNRKNGFFDAYFDGQIVVHQERISTTVLQADNRFFQFRVGLYASSWYLPSDLPGNATYHPTPKLGSGDQQTKVVFHDQIAYAPTYEHADPNQWFYYFPSDISDVSHGLNE